MATHHGKEGVVTIGGTAVGELTSFTIETTGDVVEDTALTDATKSFVAGRTSFSGTLFPYGAILMTIRVMYEHQSATP